MNATPHAAQQWALEAQMRLAELASPDNAASMAAYMKHQFAFYGIQTAARRTCTAPLIAALGKRPEPEFVLCIAEALWAYPQRECQYLAADILRKFALQLPAEAEPRLANLVISKAWWDTVDTLAAHVYGVLATQHPATLPTLLQHATSPHLWLRRVAVLYPLMHKHTTDTARLTQILDLNLSDTDFFIRKAIGWILRQYARCQPDWVRGYVDSRGDLLAPLSRREALKHL